MTLLCTSCMDSFHHVRIPRERLEGGRIIGLQQVRSRALLRLEINQRLPGQVILQVAPEPLHGVQLWTIRWPPHRPYLGGPPQALGGVGAPVIPAHEVQAVGKGLGEGIHEALEHVGMQRGACQEAARTRRRGHGAIDRAPGAGVLEGPQRLDPWGRESPSAHRQEAHTTGVLTAHAHGVGMHRWQDARQPLLTGRLQRSNGLWVFLVCLGRGTLRCVLNRVRTIVSSVWSFTSRCWVCWTH